MSYSRNTVLTAVFTLATVALVAQNAQACKGGGGRSRGYSGGSSRSYSSHNSHSSRVGHYARPVQYHSPAPPPVRVIQTVRPVQAISAAPVVSQPTIQQPAPLQQIAQPQVRPQPGTVQENSPAMSALQALGGFAPPESLQSPVHVGNWSATLGNGATVSLTLQADGNFSWTAANASGGTSSFSGNYAVANGSLSLSRSNDGQQLAGTMTATGNDAFSFQLAGNNAAAINFNRS